MSDREDAEVLIITIKAKVRELKWNEDFIAMDKYCGEIDSLMYTLRQLIIPPRRYQPKVDWLAELEKEVLNDLS